MILGEPVKCTRLVLQVPPTDYVFTDAGNTPIGADMPELSDLFAEVHYQDHIVADVVLHLVDRVCLPFTVGRMTWPFAPDCMTIVS